MKKSIQILAFVSVIVQFAIIIMFTQKGCNNVAEIQNDTITVTDTLIKHDTTYLSKVIKVKEPTKTVYIEIPAIVDTAEILKKYFATTFRDDTLMNDSSLFFRLKQTITKNDVVKQEIEMYDFENTIVVNKETTINVPVPSPRFYVGAFTSFSQNKAVLGAKITYKTQKDILISAGYGTSQTVLLDISIPLNLFTKNK